MQLLTIFEFAILMKVTRQTIYNWRKEGLPFETTKPPRISKEKGLQWVKDRGKQ